MMGGRSGDDLWAAARHIVSRISAIDAAGCASRAARFPVGNCNGLTPNRFDDGLAMDDGWPRAYSRGRTHSGLSLAGLFTNVPTAITVSSSDGHGTRSGVSDSGSLTRGSSQSSKSSRPRITGMRS